MSRTVSHYELHSRIGAGGMGEVYRARDTRLGRSVALKFLPEAFAQDRERLARFQREAQVLASLNHPNIASLHGFEEADGKSFLVMELAEGESLEHRLEQGRLPLEECLAIGLQIAHALEEAHEHGVVHRDLKPGNVHVTADGKVKVLDFGLAKAMAPEMPEGQSTLGHSPTITAMTALGVILGTAAYMSPEQARGKNADRRSDIWSFGVVLLEMLSGKRVFEGETPSEVLASVLKDAVPLDRLPADLPPALRTLVARCLERDPRRRLQWIGEARLVLENLLSGKHEAPAAPEPVRRTWIPWTLAVLGLGLGAASLLPRSGPAEPSRTVPLRKFAVETGLLIPLERRAAVLSPDGRRIAYVQASGIWIRSLDSLEARVLVEAAGRPSSEVPANPFWSPDSRQVAYTAGGRLWRIAADGGSPTAVATVGEGISGGTWLEDDRLVYGIARSDLFVVPARGGDPQVLLRRGEGDVDFHDPWALPGGRGVLYVRHREEGVDTIEVLANGERKQLLRVPRSETENVQVVNMVCYAPTGHLLYQREQGNRGIWAVPFSLDALEVQGDPFLVASNGRDPSASDDGTLLYTPGREQAPLRLVWVDARGEILGTVVDQIHGLSAPALSPDGTRVAYAADENGAGEIWVLHLDSGNRTRLTFTPADENGPVWIPKQNRIAFVSTQEGRSSVSAVAADGSGSAAVLVEDGEQPVFSPDGRWMVFRRTSGAKAGLLRMPMDGSAEPELFLAGTGSHLYQPDLSPDGRYLAYLSWERGTPTTYLKPFPSGEGKWELPGSWESDLIWFPDRIVYLTGRPEPAMMEIPASLSGTLALGTARKLFDLRPRRLTPFVPFTASADGRRFLMVQGIGEAYDADRAVIVENWPAEFAGN